MLDPTLLSCSPLAMKQQVKHFGLADEENENTVRNALGLDSFIM